MRTLLAIDPGEHQGWAAFYAGVLRACGLGDPSDSPVYARCIIAPIHERVRPGREEQRRCVVERPHSHRTKARVRDILTLALRAGEAGGMHGISAGITPEYVEPSEWKGAVSKEVSHQRIREKLTEQELSCLDESLRTVAASKRHNVLDAIGIGLWAVGR